MQEQSVQGTTPFLDSLAADGPLPSLEEVRQLGSEEIRSALERTVREIIEHAQGAEAADQEIVTPFDVDILRPIRYQIGFLEAFIRTAAAAAPRLPGRTSTWDLPGGIELKVLAARPSLDVGDEPTAIAHLAENHPQALRRHVKLSEKDDPDAFRKALARLGPLLRSDDRLRYKPYLRPLKAYLKSHFGERYQAKGETLSLPGMTATWPDPEVAFEPAEGADEAVVATFDGSTTKRRMKASGAVEATLAEWRDGQGGNLLLDWVEAVAVRRAADLPDAEAVEEVHTWLALAADVLDVVDAWLAARPAQSEEYRRRAAEQIAERFDPVTVASQEAEECANLVEQVRSELDFLDSLEREVAVRVEEWMQERRLRGGEQAMSPLYRLWMYADVLAAFKEEAERRRTERSELSEAFSERLVRSRGRLLERAELLARALFEVEDVDRTTLSSGVSARLKVPRDRAVDVTSAEDLHEYLEKHDVRDAIVRTLEVRSRDALGELDSSPSIARAGHEVVKVDAKAAKRILRNRSADDGIDPAADVVPGLALRYGTPSVHVNRRRPMMQERDEGAEPADLTDRLRRAARERLGQAGVMAPEA